MSEHDTSRADCVARWEVALVTANLREAFAGAPLLGSPLPAFDELGEAECQAWRHLQSQAVPGTVAEMDFACLLAYFRVEYGANVGRLIRAGTVSPGQEPPSALFATDAAQAALEAVVPEHLARLYARWGEPALLDALLDLRLTGGSALRARNASLLALWDDYAPEILRAASRTNARCRQVRRALLYARDTVRDSCDWRRVLRRLDEERTCREPAVRSSAREILSHITRHGPKVRCSRLDVGLARPRAARLPRWREP
jgi:hypothetical protein